MPIRSAQDYLSEAPVHVNTEIDNASVAAAANPNTSPSTSDAIGDDLKDTATGFGQGLTFGGGTKALAAMQASYDLLTGNDKKSKWDDLYTKYRDQNQKAVEDSTARSPYLTRGGELAGAILSPINKIAAPVAGLAGLGEATGVLGGLARASVEGSAIGGTAGAINQGEDESMPHAILTGALKGAGAGFAGRAVADTAGAAVGGLKNWMKENTTLGKTNSALYDLGKSGQGISTENSVNALTKANDLTAANATRSLLPTSVKTGGISDVGPLSQREMISNEYNNVLGSHVDDTGTPLPLSLPNAKNSSTAALDDFVSKNPQSFSGPEGALFKKRLDDMLSGNISAKEAHSLKLSIYGDPLASEPATANTFQNAAGEINSTLNKNVDGYSQVNKDWENHNQLLESLNGVPTDINQKYASQSPSLNNTVFGQFQKTINGIGAPGVTKLGPKSAWNNFNDTAANIATQNPSFIQKYGGFLPDLQQQIQNAGTVQGGVHVVQGTGQLGSMGDLLGSFTPKSASYRVSNIVGQGVGKMNDITNASYPKLKSIADTLSSVPGTKALGSGLSDALDNPINNMSRTTALFNIMQNPNSRKIVQGQGEGGQDNGQ